jgi:ASC-1-like (ASCH) protein
MANRVLRFRKINEDIFEAIRKGTKKIETRAATTRYSQIQKGDRLIFICGPKKFSKKVKRVKIFKSIKSLTKVYSPKQINPNTKSFKELEKMYYNYPNYKEKIKKFGLIAIELA